MTYNYASLYKDFKPYLNRNTISGTKTLGHNVYRKPKIIEYNYIFQCVCNLNISKETSKLTKGVIFTTIIDYLISYLDEFEKLDDEIKEFNDAKKINILDWQGYAYLWL